MIFYIRKNKTKNKKGRSAYKLLEIIEEFSKKVDK